MISVIEFVVGILLIIIIGIAIWNLVIIWNYSSYMGSFIYARGANATDGETINLQCESGGNICIYRATQICTNPDSNNYESSNLDPIDTSESNYGNFNLDTTVDLTQTMSQMCNGKESVNFTFSGKWPDTPCNGNSQLIATYSCVNTPEECNSWKPPK